MKRDTMNNIRLMVSMVNEEEMEEGLRDTLHGLGGYNGDYIRKRICDYVMDENDFQLREAYIYSKLMEEADIVIGDGEKITESMPEIKRYICSLLVEEYLKTIETKSAEVIECEEIHELYKKLGSEEKVAEELDLCIEDVGMSLLLYKQIEPESELKLETRSKLSLSVNPNK